MVAVPGLAARAAASRASRWASAAMSRRSEMAEIVAIVGTGLIGRAWAIAFARAGWRSALWDPTPGRGRGRSATIERLLADLAAQDLLNGAAAGRRARPHAARWPTLAEALAGADWVQENAPEDLEIKRALWRELDRLAAAGHACSPAPPRPSCRRASPRTCAGRAPLPRLPPDQPALPDPGGRAGARRPGPRPRPWPAREAVIRGIGQAPIVMRRELDGFVMNRMQGALLEEAFRLVADGYCTRRGRRHRPPRGPGAALVVHGAVRDHRPQRAGRRRATMSRATSSIYEQPVPVRCSAASTGPGRCSTRSSASAAPGCRPSELAERQRWRDRRLMALRRAQAQRRIGDIGRLEPDGRKPARSSSPAPSPGPSTRRRCRRTCR